MEKYLVINTDKGSSASTDPEFFRKFPPFDINWSLNVNADNEEQAISNALIEKRNRE